MRVATLAVLAIPSGGSLAAQGGETFALQNGTLVLEARLEPLTETAYGLEVQQPGIVVQEPFRAHDRYDVDHLRRFLPEGPVQVGDTWPVDPRAVLPFLRQILPGATDELHHGSGAAPGTYACLRWADADAAEIVLRAHAEFLYHVGSPATEVWLTPAQFRGRLRLDRRRGTVSAFELLLPDARANVDVNLSAGDHRIADIGRIACMEVRSGEFPTGEPARVLSLAAAEELLVRRFYPAAELEWLELPAALARARASGKPLHVLTMFGSLLDESC